MLNAGTQNKGNNPVKKKKESRLRRPIICICNDPWVPALRELRKLATIINFPPTQSSRHVTFRLISHPIRFTASYIISNLLTLKCSILF